MFNFACLVFDRVPGRWLSRRSQVGSWVKLSICHPKINLLPWISCIGLLLNIFFFFFFTFFLIFQIYLQYSTHIYNTYLHYSYSIFISQYFEFVVLAKRTYQSLYGLKIQNLSEATNFHIRAFELPTSCRKMRFNNRSQQTLG